MTYREEYLSYPDGLNVRIRIDENLSRPVVLLIHAAGERLEFYDHLYPYFDQYHLALCAIELRGHGLSGRTVHHIKHFEEYLKDIKRMVFGNLANRPVYIIGCNEGALIASLFASDIRFAVKGLVLVSIPLPLIISPFKKVLLTLLALISPEQYVRSYTCSRTTHADEMQHFFDEEHVRVPHEMTAGFVRALFSAERKIIRDISLLKNTPVFLVQPDQAEHIDAAATETFFKTHFGEEHSFKTLLVRHSCAPLLLEKERVLITGKIIKWIHAVETSGKLS